MPESGAYRPTAVLRRSRCGDFAGTRQISRQAPQREFGRSPARKKIRHGVGEDRSGSTEQRDQSAGHEGTGGLGDGIALVGPGVGCQKILLSHDPWEERLRRGVAEEGEHAEEGNEDDQDSEVQPFERVEERNGQQQDGPREVGSHEYWLPPPPVDERAGN